MDNLYILTFKRLTVLLENMKEKLDIKLDVKEDIQER